jgi:hypothetical protein
MPKVKSAMAVTELFLRRKMEVENVFSIFRIEIAVSGVIGTASSVILLSRFRQKVRELCVGERAS